MTRKSEKIAVMTVTAECIGCHARREIRAGEVPAGEQPTCSVCFMPMVAKGASMRRLPAATKLGGAP